MEKKNIVIFLAVIFLVICAVGSFVLFGGVGLSKDQKIQKKVCVKLGAVSRKAELMITGVDYDEVSGTNTTTAKFIEYNVGGEPLEPFYITFIGVKVEVHSFVIRFDKISQKSLADLKNKSAYLFSELSIPDKKNPTRYNFLNMEEVPPAYMIEKTVEPFEKKIWRLLWEYAKDLANSDSIEINGVEIQAPGPVFFPGTVYTVVIDQTGAINVMEDLPAGEKQ